MSAGHKEAGRGTKKGRSGKGKAPELRCEGRWSQKEEDTC